MKLHIATSRDIGFECIGWAKEQGFELVPMEECNLFISILYDKLVSAEFLRGKRAFNFHPGILPEYRGSGCFSWAIINEEKEVGITLHEIDKDIDHGNIIEIRKFPIFPKDTAERLFYRGCVVIRQMFKEWLPRLIKLDYVSSPQSEKNAKIYYKKDLDKVKDLTRFVKAFTFFGKENAYFYKDDGTKFYLLRQSRKFGKR